MSVNYLVPAYSFSSKLMTKMIGFQLKRTWKENSWNSNIYFQLLQGKERWKKYARNSINYKWKQFANIIYYFTLLVLHLIISSVQILCENWLISFTKTLVKESSRNCNIYCQLFAGKGWKKYARNSNYSYLV